MCVKQVNMQNLDFRTLKEINKTNLSYTINSNAVVWGVEYADCGSAED